MQFYDVFNAETKAFVFRAELRIISMVYRWHREAEERITRAGPVPTEMFGNDKHEDIVVVPVLNWKAPRFGHEPTA